MKEFDQRKPSVHMVKNDAPYERSGLSARKSRLKQFDITRAIKGAQAAGVAVGRVEIDAESGKIVVYSAGVGADGLSNPCDRLL